MQMFHCDLEEMGLVSQRYLIRTIVRDCPINDIWPDCLLNYVGTTWWGNRTASGRPLVEVKIQLKDSIGPDRFVTLKGHVFENLQCALNPFVHMVWFDFFRPYNMHVLNYDRFKFIIYY